MSSATLIRFGGLAAILAGILRLGTSFLTPWPDHPGAGLELFCLVIDVLILWGLLGVYAYQYEKAGKFGFLGFILALTGTAIITGPDGMIGNVSMYVVGCLMISIGLFLLAIGSWKAGRLPRSVSVLWMVSTLVGVGGFLVNESSITFMIAGVAFSLAFIRAGVKMWQHYSHEVAEEIESDTDPRF